MPGWRNLLRRQVGRLAYVVGAQIYEMITVYIIKSRQRNWHYVGLTDNLARRFKQHSSGKVKSTKAYGPFDIVFMKKFVSRKDARDFEKYLKIRSNKEKYI